MKRANTFRVVLGLTVFACAAIPVYRTLAYNEQNIITVSVDQTNAVCQSQRVLDGINRIQQGYVKQLVRDTINEFKSIATTYAFQLLICTLTDFDKTVSPSILGFSAGSITFKGPNCNKDLGGAVSSAVKRVTLDKIKNDFAARCIADGARRKVGNDIRQITRENGPDGGPAYVSDWVAVYADEDQRAINRFNAILVNTEICPYFREAVYEYFGVPQSYIDNPPAMTGLGLRVDGDSSFVQNGQCTLPENFSLEQFDANFLAMGGFPGVMVLLYPPNNFEGFIAMAEAELYQQRTVGVEAAVNEAVAGGGFRGVYGDATQSCLNRDPDGNCLAHGPVQQPAGGIRDANAATVQAELDWINGSKEMNQLMGDVRSRLASMIMNLGADPLEYTPGPDQSSQVYQDIGAGTRPPDDVLLPQDVDNGGQGQPPGPTGPPPASGAPPAPTPTPTACGSTTDLTCNNNNPQRCFCARDCTMFSAMTSQVDLAVRAACIQHEDLVDSPTGCGAVNAGSEELFTRTVCSTTVGEQILGCHVKAGTNDTIVLELGAMSLSIDILSPSGAILIPGQLVSACQPGSQ